MALLVPQELLYFLLNSSILSPEFFFPLLLPIVPILNLEQTLDGVALKLLVDHVSLVEDCPPPLPLSFLLD